MLSKFCVSDQERITNKKKPDILLVQLPPWDPRMVPLGIAYLVSFLKSKSIAAEVFDLNIYMYNTKPPESVNGWNWVDDNWWSTNNVESEFLPRLDDFTEKILQFDAPVIGFSANTNSIVFLNLLLECIKQKSPDKKIVVGGPAVFFEKVRVLDFNTNLIDYFIKGDGELALYKLMRSLNKNDEIDFREDESCKIWKDDPDSRPLCLEEKVMDLDAVGHPTFEEFDLSVYEDRGNSLPIIFGKGCSRHCVFCSDTVICAPLRFRTPKKVVEEIKSHLQRFPNVGKFRLNDLGFNADLNFLDEFCDRIIDEGIKISWRGQAQVRPDTKRELLVKMKRAGCQAMELGVENFSDNVLGLMKKQYTGAQAANFLKEVKETGIRTELLFIIGFPGETRDDFYLNLEFIKNNAAYIDRFNSLNICGFPVGCELFANPEKFGYLYKEHEDWQTFDGENTWQERKWRLNELTLCCRRLGIPFDLSIDVEMHDEILKGKSIKLIN